MLPFLVLMASTLVLRALGAAGIIALQSWTICLRSALALMFLLTSTAHWGKRRPDLVRMVPAAFPRPDLIVTITGVLEILGALGLLFPATASAAAACLAVLLIALFPANAHAARERLTIGGKPATPLPLRTLLQIAFIAALIAAGFADHLAVWPAPARTASAKGTEKAMQAGAKFWDQFAHVSRLSEQARVAARQLP
jgi:uncharacterized membrane protein